MNYFDYNAIRLQGVRFPHDMLGRVRWMTLAEMRKLYPRENDPLITKPCKFDWLEYSPETP